MTGNSAPLSSMWVAKLLGHDDPRDTMIYLHLSTRKLKSAPSPLRMFDLAYSAWIFRGKFHDGLKALFRQKKLSFQGSLSWLAEPRSFARFLHTLHRHRWVVDVRKPFGGPEHVLHYLARYTHRVAISNHRLISLQDGKVTFRWKDYAHGGKKRKMTLDASEFIRRFLLHVLPKGLVRIRYYGWMANRCRRQRATQCRELLEAEPEETLLTPAVSLGGRRCPVCGGAVEVVELIVPRELRRWRSSRQRVPDSS